MNEITLPLYAVNAYFALLHWGLLLKDFNKLLFLYSHSEFIDINIH